MKKERKRMQRVRYGIKGRSCAACVAHVERAVRGVLGEEAVFSVSLLTNSLSVIPSAEISDARELARLEERLSAAIRAAGYALLTEPEKKERPTVNIKKV